MAPRHRHIDHDLPPRLYRHGQSYRYVPKGPDGRNLTPVNLGRDRAQALKRWAELAGSPAPDAEQAPNPRTIAGIWARYERDILPGKAAATQRSNHQEVKRLLIVFGRLDVAQIAQHHAIEYLDRRAVESPTQANREIALLRHMLTKAVHWALIDRNPLLGLEYRAKERPRDLYVTDEAIEYAMTQAGPTLSALMWLGYLTGLRRGDLLHITRFQITTEGLELRERKTGKRVQIQWTPELRRCVQDALDASPDDRLFPLTETAVNVAWGRLMRKIEAAGHTRFQMKDLRAKHATDFESHGGDATIQLGHSSRTITARHYLRAPRSIIPIR